MSPWSFPWGISTLVPGAPTFPSLFTDLSVCRVVSFTFSHLSLSKPPHNIYFSFPKLVITEAQTMLIIGSDFSVCGPLGLGGTGCD